MSSPPIPTRDRILKAAWNILEHGGGKPARMSDIARAAGVSRQAVYLHFADRAALLIATTRFMDQEMDVQGRLGPFRDAATGVAKLRKIAAFCHDHYSNVQGVARALIAMRETDAEADAAWRDRMAAVREACASTVAAFIAEGRLAPGWDPEAATDVLWTILSFESWERLATECGWSRDDYTARLPRAAEAALTTA